VCAQLGLDVQVLAAMHEDSEAEDSEAEGKSSPITSKNTYPTEKKVL
jgi:hypothetical protein